MLTPRRQLLAYLERTYPLPKPRPPRKKPAVVVEPAAAASDEPQSPAEVANEHEEVAVNTDDAPQIDVPITKSQQPVRAPPLVAASVVRALAPPPRDPAYYGERSTDDELRERVLASQRGEPIPRSPETSLRHELEQQIMREARLEKNEGIEAQRRHASALMDEGAVRQARPDLPDKTVSESDVAETVSRLDRSQVRNSKTSTCVRPSFEQPSADIAPRNVPMQDVVEEAEKIMVGRALPVPPAQRALWHPHTNHENSMQLQSSSYVGAQIVRARESKFALNLQSSLGDTGSFPFLLTVVQTRELPAHLPTYLDPDAPPTAAQAAKLASQRVVRREVHEAFMRTPMPGERPCIEGANCVGMRIPGCIQITLVEFPPPEAIAHFNRTGTWIQERYMCVLCDRQATNYARLAMRPACTQLQENVLSSGTQCSPEDYDLRDCIVSSSQFYDGSLAPVPIFCKRFYASEQRDGIVYLTQHHYWRPRDETVSFFEVGPGSVKHQREAEIAAQRTGPLDDDGDNKHARQPARFESQADEPVLNRRDVFRAEPYYERFRLVNPWQRLLSDNTVYERKDTPARVVRVYFKRLARAHAHESLAPSWLTDDFAQLELHEHVLPTAFNYVWHPLGTTAPNYDASAHMIYNTCVNRMQRAHELSTVEWLPIEVRRALVLLCDEHQLLTLHMEHAHRYDDAYLTRERPFGAGRNRYRLHECDSLPHTSLYEQFMPRLEAVFEMGSLPDLIMIVCNYVPIWGEPRDGFYADPVVDRLATYIFKVIPVPFRKRALPEIVAADVLVYPTVYNIMQRLLFALFLGSYDYVQTVASFDARRALYARFALKPMTPRELSAWILENKFTTRFAWMEYVIVFAIEAVPALERLFRERYNWDVVVRSIKESCDFVRRRFEMAVRRDQRDWLARACAIRVKRQANVDPLALVLRNAFVIELIDAFPNASVWRLDGAVPATITKRFNALLATPIEKRSESDNAVISLLDRLGRSDICRRLASLLRTPLEIGGAQEPVNAFERLCAFDDDSTRSQMCRRLSLAIDEAVPERTVTRWLSMVSELGDTFEDEHVHALMVRAVARTFSSTSFGVEEHLEAAHKSLLKVSFRPAEQSFVQRALAVCAQLDDRFYVDARFRDAPASFTREQEQHMKRTILSFENSFDLSFEWLVLYGVSLLSIDQMRLARRLFCSETLRSLIGTTLDALILTNYHDYYVFKRFLFWRNQHVQVQVFDLPAEVTRAQLERCLELRRCAHVADLEPTLCSFYYCVHCRKFKGLYTGTPSDLYPVKSGARRKRVKRISAAAEAAAASASSTAASFAENIFSVGYVQKQAIDSDDEDSDDDNDNEESQKADRIYESEVDEMRRKIAQADAQASQLHGSEFTSADAERLREQQAHLAKLSALSNGEQRRAVPVPVKEAKRKLQKRARLVDVSNRVIDTRHRTALGNVDTFYDPSDDQVYCKNINIDSNQIVTAYRAEADQRLAEYATFYGVTQREAIRWVTMLAPKLRSAAEHEALRKKRAGLSQSTALVATTTTTSTPQNEEREHVTGQRRYVAVERKRRGLMPMVMDSLSANELVNEQRLLSEQPAQPAVLVEPAQLRAMDPQNFKRISKRERQTRETELCGYEPLPMVNLIGRVFCFYNKLFFKCPNCIMPSIATFHFSKLASCGDFSFTCSFCDRDADKIRLKTGDYEHASERQHEADSVPKKRFECVVCGPSRLFVAAHLKQALVYDDVTAPAAPRLMMHQFCRQHSRLAYSSAGRILELSLIKRSLEEGWRTRYEPKTGQRIFVRG